MAPSVAAGRETLAGEGLTGKLIVGYQGWFGCPDDGGPQGTWNHWFTGNRADADHVHFDFAPDVSELPAAERCRTGLQARDGSELELFSAQNPNTVARHFQWMRTYGIDGAALQRFVLGLEPGYPAAGRAAEDRVLDNVRSAAEANDRAFFVMYDIVAADPQHWVDTLLSDWSSLCRSGLTRSAAYLRHRGRPLIALAGLGSNTRPGTPADAARLIQALRGPDAGGGATVMGVLPTNWRTLDGDAYSDPAWTEIFLSLDVMSPWTVGRYGNETEYQRYRSERLEPDLALARAHGIDYMPNIFPGFSAHNLFRREGKGESPPDVIPRHHGQFLWTQAVGAVQAGADTIYAAMFDEVDEGTALFKLVPEPQQLPATPPMVPLDTDAEALPSDWYLRLCGQIARLLRHERAADGAMPIQWPVPTTRRD